MLTDDPELAKNIRHFITHDFNLRMPALNAALGIPQLERIEKTISAKREVAHAYRAFLQDLTQDSLRSQRDAGQITG